MKTFSTSGTGSGQTLSEIESDKMPIYDTLTDVEADLANLEVGQIGATKGTGSELSAPVDTVQSGNMHAVTSNAVAESLSYSETERFTGGYWIDGKPIYRKVVDCGNAPNGSPQSIASKSTNHNISNIGAIAKLDLYAIFASPFSTLSIPFIDRQGNELDGVIDSTKITIRANNNASGYKVIAIIEYTKATD